jgi:hypothetical protein
MVRRVSVFLSVVGFGLLSAVPADAATPAFDLDVEARRGSVVITVTFEPVPPGFNWAAFESSGVPDELVGVLPAEEVDERGRPLSQDGLRLASLRSIEEGVYLAEVAVDQGRWAVVPWPLVPDFSPGAPSTRFVNIDVGTSPML